MGTLGEKSVGDLVYLEENGVSVAYRIVHKGLPSSLYDSSCDGVWLFRCGMKMTLMESGNISPDYANSKMHSNLNSMLSLFSTEIQVMIQSVKIPYRAGSTGTAINSGSSGLSCKLFCLSSHEMGAYTDYQSGNTLEVVDGAKLDYYQTGFETSALNLRVDDTGSYGTYSRTPWRTGGSDNSAIVGIMKGFTLLVSSSGIYHRWAMIMPYDAPVDSSGKISSNSAPSTPSTITAPASIKGGETVSLSWTTSTDPDSNLEGYILERSVDGGSWSQIYNGSGLSTTNMVEYGTNTVQYRVSAYDSVGATSGYVTSSKITVTNNTPPKISGTDSDLGTLETAPELSYTVTDDEGGVVKVVEAVDGTQQAEYEVTLGQENTLVWGYHWVKIGNGFHIFTLTATDSQGDSAQRTHTFTKNETQIHLQYLEPLETENPVVLGILTVDKFIAEGASFSVEVCNNALDNSPTWENVTSAVNLGGRFYLNNTDKTAQKWAFNVRVMVKRETAKEDSWISEVSGYFREG